MAHTTVTKAHSANTGVANTYSYSGSFDVFKGTEVAVELDNVALTYTASTINESASPREYSVDVTAKTIHIGGADLSSGTIIIRPETDMGAPTPRATYSPGASITSDDLNNNQLQLMRKAMEYDEQKLSSTGGTMTGDLTMGEDTKIIFEGATDDAHETTLTVTDPTADRTITIPNVTGTVVTTGDTATVTATMMAADSVDSSELVDGSIDASHISAGAVEEAKIANGAVTNGKLGADAVNGAKIADDSIDSEHYVDASIDHAHLANDCVDGDNIADDAVDSEHYVDGSIDAAHIASNAVTTAKINADAVTGAKIADDAIDSEHYTDGSIDTAHIADANVTLAKLEAVADTQIIVGNGSNRPTAVAMSGDATIANTGAVTIANDAIEIGMIGCEQTTISDSDSHIPTSGAVVDYVAAQLAPIGGLEVIADDESFPNTIPSTGVVISISDAAGLQINSSGVSTNGDTLDNSTVTINGFPSELRGGVGGNADPYVLAAVTGLMVQSTGSSHTYNYHQVMIREADFVQLSDDISDFNSRYRIAGSAPGSDNDEGDLYFDTGANKMYVYDGSAWGEVTSTGDYKFLTIKDHDQAVGGSGPTFNGSNEEFDLFDGSSDASINSAAQLLVVLNGVLQKPNDGTFSGSEEGFYLDGADGIRFCDPPPSGSVCFVTQIGSTVTLNEPADGSVIAVKIGAGAVTTAKIGADAVDGTKIADNAIDSEHYTDGSIDHVHLAGDCVDGDNIGDDVVNSEHIAAGAVDLEHMSSESVDEDNLKISNSGTNGQYLQKQSGNTGGLTWSTVSTTPTTTRGDIIYRAASADARLAKGTSGQFLKIGANDPEWADVPAGVGGATGLDLNDNVEIRLGTDNDLTFDHTGSDGIIRNGTGDFYIKGDDVKITGLNDENIAIFNENSDVQLYHNGTKTLSTNSEGITVQGGEGSTGSVYLYADDGDDNADKWVLQAKSDASAFTIQNNNAGAWDTNFKANGDAAVELYYDNSKK